MKETTRASRAVGQLEKMHRAINQDSFGGALDEPIITISSTPGAYGHITIMRVWQSKGEARYELNISADYLARPIESVAATLIHEMTHQFNLMNGIQDCSRGGTYHNKKFKAEAEKHMISVDCDSRYGWTITSPTDELLEYILEKGWTELMIERNPLFGALGGSGSKGKAGAPGKPDGEKPKSSTRKYMCPCCGTIIRATKEVNVICGEDGAKFELA